MSATRRALLVGLAAFPAGVMTSAPASALPAAADPTFALIERHRAAYAAFNAALGPDIDDAPAEDEAEREAMGTLLTPEPTTLAGLRALALYMAAHDKRTGDFQTAQWALATLAEACRNLIGGVA